MADMKFTRRDALKAMGAASAIPLVGLPAISERPTRNAECPDMLQLIANAVEFDVYIDPHKYLIDQDWAESVLKKSELIHDEWHNAPVNPFYRKICYVWLHRVNQLWFTGLPKDVSGYGIMKLVRDSWAPGCCHYYLCRSSISSPGDKIQNNPVRQESKDTLGDFWYERNRIVYPLRHRDTPGQLYIIGEGPDNYITEGHCLLDEYSESNVVGKPCFEWDRREHPEFYENPEYREYQEHSEQVWDDCEFYVANRLLVRGKKPQEWYREQIKERWG